MNYSKLIIIGAITMLGILLSGCMGSIEQYKNDTPKLNLEDYLKGKITGQGLIENWKGNIVSRFDFSGDASWKNSVGTFKEKMTYYNGKEDHRTWIIKKVSHNHYIGTTKGVIGQAKINVVGNAMHWSYSMNVEVNDSTYRLSFNDRMYLMHDGTLININYFKKFGLTVGRLVLFMKKD